MSGLGEAGRLNVLIAYETLAMGRAAERVYSNLVDALGGEFLLHLDLWRFDVLEISEIRAAAARSAAESDIIFIAASGQKPLPQQVRQWIETWLVERRENPRALAALFDLSAGGPCGPHSALGFLRDAACEGALNYFEWSRDEEMREMDWTPSNLNDRRYKSSSTLDGILGRDVMGASRFHGMSN